MNTLLKKIKLKKLEIRKFPDFSRFFRCVWTLFLCFLHSKSRWNKWGNESSQQHILNVFSRCFTPGNLECILDKNFPCNKFQSTLHNNVFFKRINENIDPFPTTFWQNCDFVISYKKKVLGIFFSNLFSLPASCLILVSWLLQSR